MTTQERSRRKLAHVIVDLLEIVGGGMVADAIARRSLLSGGIALVVIAVGLWLDRRNALRES